VARRVVSALDEPRTAERAAATLPRLGDAAVPVFAAALAPDEARRRSPVIRPAAAAAAEHGVQVLEPALHDPDRAVVLTALDALDAAGGAGVVPPELLDDVFRDAAAHAARPLVGRTSPPTSAPPRWGNSNTPSAAPRSGSRTWRDDPEGVWRSSWLAVCASHAPGH
jgi:hypothetical protein